MPIPSPNKGEGKDKFMSRCMGNPTMNKEYSDNKQRYAVCQSKWSEKKKRSKGSYEVGGEEFLLD